MTGSLCENNDKFAVDRMLPEIQMGDLLFIHDTGAHGFSMGYNYNGKLRSAELLLQEDGSVRMIRRAETPKDYFATFDFCGLLKDSEEIICESCKGTDPLPGRLYPGAYGEGRLRGGAGYRGISPQGF